MYLPESCNTINSLLKRLKYIEQRLRLLFFHFLGERRTRTRIVFLLLILRVKDRYNERSYRTNLSE